MYESLIKKLFRILFEGFSSVNRRLKVLLDQDVYDIFGKTLIAEKGYHIAEIKYLADNHANDAKDKTLKRYLYGLFIYGKNKPITFNVDNESEIRKELQSRYNISIVRIY